MAVARDLLADALRGVRQDDRADGRDEEQDERVQRVDAVLDAVGCRPTSQLVADGPHVQDAYQHEHRDREGSPADDQAEPDRQGALAGEHAQRRCRQRYEDLQDRELFDHASSSAASSSSSSIVP